jgi:hypothetical protein
VEKPKNVAQSNFYIEKQRKTPFNGNVTEMLFHKYSTMILNGHSNALRL